ncbi:MAG TPA: hypothetical protein VJM11_18995 [Nevskiaceae bacterium]|nr:hypothetical protein [Nevskiaceae bacterium]
MAVARYRIEDEPRPGAMAQLAVNPLWPLLSVMLGGFLIGVTWFVINGIAVGSPTRNREIVAAVAGLAGALAIAVTLALAVGAGWLPGAAAQYALLPLLLWKLGTAYLLYEWQSRTIQIHEHYGGVLRNGLPLVIVAALVRKPLLLASPSVLWRLVAG